MKSFCEPLDEKIMIIIHAQKIHIWEKFTLSILYTFVCACVYVLTKIINTTIIIRSEIETNANLIIGFQKHLHYTWFIKVWRLE